MEQARFLAFWWRLVKGRLRIEPGLRVEIGLDRPWLRRLAGRPLREPSELRTFQPTQMSSLMRALPVPSLSILLLASAAHAEPRKPTHVACVGDSITAGAGSSSPSKNYVEQLQGLLGSDVQVENFGRSGATMLSAGFGDLPYDDQVEYTNATSFVTNAGANAVVSVVIVLGANDSKPYNWEPNGKPKNDQQFLSDYRALVEHFAGLPSKPVIYLGLPMATGNNPCCNIRGNVIHDEQVPLIQALALEKHLPVIDLNTPSTGHPEYFGDGVHPNDAGYLVMAMLVQQGLARVPTVSITSPSMGGMLGGMIPLTAEASGGTVLVDKVEFFEGATLLGSAAAAPFTFNWAAPLGMHSVTAKATDTTLAWTTSNSVTFEATAAGGGAGVGGAASGGAAAGGVSSGGGPAPLAGSGGSGTSGSAPVTAVGAPATDASCGCSVPGTRGSGGAAWLMLLGALALGLRGRIRHRAG